MKYFIWITFNILEIFIDICKIFANIIYFCIKPKYSYDNIISLEYSLFAPPDCESYYICNREKKFKQKENIDEDYFDKIAKINNVEFQKLIETLKNNKILNFNRYIHKVDFSSYEDFFYVDDGETPEQTLKICFSDNKCYYLDVNCMNRRFENIVKEINRIIDDNLECL